MRVQDVRRLRLSGSDANGGRGGVPFMAIQGNGTHNVHFCHAQTFTSCDSSTLNIHFTCKVLLCDIEHLGHNSTESR